MSIQTAIQNKIAELTNDGEDIAACLAGILRSADPSITTYHRIEAARILTKYGATQQEGKLIPFNPTDNNTSSLSMDEEPAPGEHRGWDWGEGNEDTPSALTGESWDGGEAHGHDHP